MTLRGTGSGPPDAGNGQATDDKNEKKIQHETEDGCRENAAAFRVARPKKGIESAGDAEEKDAEAQKADEKAGEGVVRC
jgi:hypothetical protein